MKIIKKYGTALLIKYKIFKDKRVFFIQVLIVMSLKKLLN